MRMPHKRCVSPCVYGCQCALCLCCRCVESPHRSGCVSIACAAQHKLQFYRNRMWRDIRDHTATLTFHEIDTFDIRYDVYIRWAAGSILFTQSHPGNQQYFRYDKISFFFSISTCIVFIISIRHFGVESFETQSVHFVLPNLTRIFICENIALELRSIGLDAVQNACCVLW